MDFLSFNLIFLALINILKYKSVHNVINFHCYDAGTALSVQKYFSAHEIRVASVNKFHTSTKLFYLHSRLGFILNTTCENWTSGIDFTDVITKFKGPFSWFILTEDLIATENALSKYPIEIDSRVTVIEINGNNFYSLYEMYNTGFYTHGTFVVKQIGHWNMSLHIEEVMRTNLTGVVLRSVVVVRIPIKNETYLEYVERSRPTKYDMAHTLKYFTLLKYFRDMYHHRYQLIRSNSWGYVRNGSFDGQVGSLAHNTSDIGGSPVYFRLERALLVDPTIQVWKFRPVFIFRQPKHPGGYFSIFTRPLSTTVWLCILLVLALSSAILGLLLKLKLLRIQGDDDDSSFSLAMLTIWSGICQQGNNIVHRSTSVKLVTFVTCVFAVTIYQYYNATIVSTLLQEPLRVIRNANDLLASDLKLGAHDIIYNHDFFKNSKDPVVRQLYEKKIKTPSGEKFYTLEEGMAKVKKGGFAFLVDDSLAYTVMTKTFHEKALCDSGEIVIFPPQKMYGIIQKGSPYIDHVRVAMRLMYETGIMQRILSIWDEPRPACVRTPDSSLITVSLREFTTPLVALAAGAFLSTLVLVLEIIVYRFSSFNAPRGLRFRN